MKEGWKYIMLGEVCEKCKSIKWKDIPQEKNYIYIDLSAVSRDTLQIEETQTICASNAPSRARQIIYYDDILFATTRPTLRRVCRVPKKYDKQICSTGFCVLRPQAKILSSFLFYIMQSDAFYSYIEPLQTGANYPAVTDDAVKKYIVPVPPISEQQRIVALLDSEFAKIDALKANAERNLQNAKDLFQSILRKILTPNEDWIACELKDVCDFYNGKPHENDVDENGHYVLVNSKFISSDMTSHKKVKNQLFPLFVDDIVMVMSDVPNGKALAKCQIIDADNIYSLNQRICVFRDAKLNVRFLYYIINRNPFLLAFNNGENQTNLRKNDIVTMPIRFPKNDVEILSIVNCLDALNENCKTLQANYEKTIALCDDLKQALLRKAFNGEI